MRSLFLAAMSILIFANGIIDQPDWIRPFFVDARAVIAADGGTRHLLALDRLPDVVIGDLDSLPEGTRARLDAHGTTILRYPPDKDETDLELALLYAAGRFPDDPLLIFGGFGGRVDQTLANILLLAHPALGGRDIRFVEARETAWLVTGETRVIGAPGDTVSLLPLGGEARVAKTTGLRWPLRDEALVFGPARGISNEMTAAEATVSLASGKLLVIHGRKRPPGADYGRQATDH